MPNASTPWSSRTVAEGGTDSPVGDLVPVPDEIKPVVNTGFISLSGKYTGLPSDDLQFTFQDPAQALAAGASMFIDVDLMQHDGLIFAILDSSGNDVNVDVMYRLPATPTGPYTPFATVGVQGEETWHINKAIGSGQLEEVLNDTSSGLYDTWIFYKLIKLRGTVGTIVLRSNEGADAGTISTAYLRLV